MTRGEPLQPVVSEHLGSDLAINALVNQIVAGVLQQQCDATFTLNLAVGRRFDPSEDPQQRRLAGAVATHQRRLLAGQQREIKVAQDLAAVWQLEGEAVATQRRRRARLRAARPARPPALALLLSWLGSLDGVEQPVRLQRRARLLDPRRWRPQAGALEEPRGWRLQRRLMLGRPAEHLARRRVTDQLTFA